MEQITTLHRLRAPVGHHRADPVRAVGGHVGDLEKGLAQVNAALGEGPHHHRLIWLMGAEPTDRTCTLPGAKCAA